MSQNTNNANSSRYHNYTAQRNYSYESHDADHNFNGLTEEEFKARIRAEWTPDKLKANSVVLIFHDADIGEDGTPTGLHAHAVINFEDALTPSNAMKRLGCSKQKDCREIKDSEHSVLAYRYLLHITEKAIDEGKHIYDEQYLEFYTADGKPFNYHKAISGAEAEKKETKDSRKMLKKILEDIAEGNYEKDLPDSECSKVTMIRDLILLDPAYKKILIKNPGYMAKIEKALDIFGASGQAKTPSEWNATLQKLRRN